MKQVSESLAQVSVDLYVSLASKASLEEIEDKGTFTVYRGSLLRAFESVCKTRSYYVPAYALLRISNCISILNRGARSTGSLVVLHSAPSLTELMEIDPDLLTNEGARAKLGVEAQMKDLLVSFRGINVPETFMNHENRIKALENEIKNIKERKENV